MLTVIARVLLSTTSIKLYSMLLSVNVLLLAMLTTVDASYIPPDQVDSDTFTYFSRPTAWDQGVNTAREGGFPAPGGATWSIMGAGLTNALGGDASHGTAATVDIGSLGFDQTAIENMINSALDTWANVSGFSNLGKVADGNVGFGELEINNGHLGDIRIGAIAFDNEPPSVLAHGYQPGTESIFGAGGTIAGDIHIDSSEDWVNTFDLETVILHELGHALGLGHSSDINAIMYPVYSASDLTLKADDIAGIQSIYGPAAVPLPAAAYLFLSGIGLLGFFRHKHS